MTYLKKIMIFLMFFFMLSSSSVFGKEENSFLVGRIVCDDNINFSNISITSNVVFDNISEKNILNVSNNGKIYADNKNIDFLSVDLSTLPFGYGILNDAFAFDGDPVFIKLYEIESIKFDDKDLEYKFYCKSGQQLFAVFTNDYYESSISMQHGNINEKLISDNSSTLTYYGSRSNLRDDINSQSIPDDIISTSLIDFYFYIDSSVEINDNFLLLYEECISKIVYIYSYFESIFNVLPYSFIVDDTYILKVTFGCSDTYSGFVGDFGSSIIYISYVLSPETLYDEQYIDLLLSHEIAHCFIYFMSLVNNFSSPTSFIFGYDINEGIAEFLSIYYSVIYKNYNTVDINLKNRIQNEYIIGIKNDLKDSNTDYNGYNPFLVKLTESYEDSGYSNFIFYLFLYDYYNSDCFEIIKIILNIFSEAGLSGNASYDRENTVIDSFNYLKNNCSVLYPISLRNNEYNLDILVDLYNRYLLFPEEMFTCVPDQLFEDFDVLCENNSELVNIFPLTSNNSIIYEKRIDYNKKYDYITRRFIVKRSNQYNFSEDLYYSLHLKYYCDMHVEIVYKSLSGNLSNYSYYFEYNSSLNEENNSYLKLYVPADTITYVYISYLHTNTICYEARCQFVQTSRFINLYNLNEYTCYDNKVLLNEDYVLEKYDIFTGIHHLSYVSNNEFQIQIFDSNLNLLNNYSSIFSLNDLKYHIDILNYNNIGINYFIFNRSISQSQSIEYYIYNNSFLTNYSSYSSITNVDGNFVCEKTINFKCLEQGLFYIDYKLFNNNNYNISFNIKHDNNIIYKLQSYGGLAIYNVNNGYAYLKQNYSYSINCIFTSSINNFNNVFFSLIDSIIEYDVGDDYYTLKEFNNETYDSVLIVNSISNCSLNFYVGYRIIGYPLCTIYIYLNTISSSGLIMYLDVGFNNTTFNFNYNLRYNDKLYIIALKDFTNDDLIVEIYNFGV